MPRKQWDSYPDVDTETHAEWVHRLGNLVLLDQKKNSSLSNADYETKWHRYQKAFEARPYTQSVFMRHNTWSIEKLKEQHDYAVELLAEYYTRNSLEGLRQIRSNPIPAPRLL